MEYVLISLTVVVATSFWVLFDAQALGVRKERGKSDVTNMGPAEWFVSCLLLWIVVFPLYISKRDGFKAAQRRRDDEMEKGAAAAADVPEWIKDQTDVAKPK